MCHFPFKYLNKTYTSCAHINITNFNLKGEPWCATEVESDGITVKEHKWSLCQDERTIIVDGDGKSYMKFDNMVMILLTHYSEIIYSMFLQFKSYLITRRIQLLLFTVVCIEFRNFFAIGKVIALKCTSNDS